MQAEFPTIQKTLPDGVTIRPFYDRADLTARTIATALACQPLSNR